jgi:hypothetical protein
MPTGRCPEADLTRNAVLVRRAGVPGVWGRLHAGAGAGRACVRRTGGRAAA